MIGSRYLATDLAIGIPIATSRRAPCWRCAAPIGWASRLSPRPGRTTTGCCPMPLARPTRTSQPRCFPVRCSSTSPGHVRFSGADDERDPACVVRSRSIRVRRVDQVAGDAWPAPGPRWWPGENPRTAAKLGFRRSVAGPRINGLGNDPSSTALTSDPEITHPR
jgi:hypothetical protein